MKNPGFGNRLRALRLAMGYDDTTAFAEFVGVPSAIIERFEDGGIDGDSDADTGAFVAIGSRCNCSFDWLFDGTGHAGARARQPSAGLDSKVTLFPAHRCRPQK